MALPSRTSSQPRKGIQHGSGQLSGDVQERGIAACRTTARLRARTHSGAATHTSKGGSWWRLDRHGPTGRIRVPLIRKVLPDPRLALGDDRGRHPARFRVRLQSPMGTGRRSTRKQGFIDSVLDAVVGFYAGVLQDITPFTPKAPHIERPSPAPADANPSEVSSPDTAPTSEPADWTRPLRSSGSARGRGW